jgi:hypothetical protein
MPEAASRMYPPDANVSYYVAPDGREAFFDVAIFNALAAAYRVMAEFAAGIEPNESGVTEVVFPDDLQRVMRRAIKEKLRGASTVGLYMAFQLGSVAAGAAMGRNVFAEAGAAVTKFVRRRSGKGGRK